MIKTNEKLSILYDDNGVFTDYSKQLSNYSRGSATITYISAEDIIYVGFKKPINQFYVDITTLNINAVDLSLKYYDGSSYVEPDGLYDDTDGFTRSGFIRWDRNQKNASDELDEAVSTVNTQEKYWYKITLSGDSSEFILNGINVVFCDDEDLKRELFEIDQYLPSGQSSHILTLEACRDEIVQSLNLYGKSKKDATTERESDISVFDLLDFSEVKLASTYLALAKIMMNVSDQVDDAYLQKSQMYRSKYNDILSNMSIRIDADDDGIDDKIERENQYYGVVKRI